MKQNISKKRKLDVTPVGLPGAWTYVEYRLHVPGVNAMGRGYNDRIIWHTPAVPGSTGWHKWFPKAVAELNLCEDEAWLVWKELENNKCVVGRKLKWSQVEPMLKPLVKAYRKQKRAAVAIAKALQVLAA